MCDTGKMRKAVKDFHDYLAHGSYSEELDSCKDTRDADDLSMQMRIKAIKIKLEVLPELLLALQTLLREKPAGPMPLEFDEDGPWAEYQKKVEVLVGIQKELDLVEQNTFVARDEVYSRLQNLAYNQAIAEGLDPDTLGFDEPFGNLIAKGSKNLLN